MTVLSKSFIPCEPDFGHYKSFKSLSYKGGSVSEFTSCKLSKQGPVLGPGIRREMRGNWARFGALSFVVASVGLNTSAQTVYNVPVGSLAVLPEGSTRELEAPFTEIQLPESAKESNDPEVANLQGANDTTFVSFDDSFSAILGDSPQLKLLAEKDYPFAHEGAVYLPQTNEVFFVSNLLSKIPNKPIAELWALNLDNSSLRLITPCRQITTPNGAFLYKDNKIALLLQGQTKNNETLPGGILQVDPVDGKCEWILNTFLGLQFNSPNDIVIDSNNVFWFTDPQYAHDQKVKQEVQLGNYVWRYDPEQGVPRVVLGDLVRPNGLALPQDESVVYVTDTGFQKADVDPSGPRFIYAYDFAGSKKNFLVNKRVFATADSGIPDGLKVDKLGNVWAGCGDGVNAWNSDGDLIGKILVPGGVSNFCFTGPDLDSILLLNEERVYSAELSY